MQVCQSKAEGGNRCSPTITATASRRLRRQVQSLEKRGVDASEKVKALESLTEAREKYGPVVSPLDIPMPQGVQKVLDGIRANGYQPLLVGGTVRDAIVDGRPPKDFDIEVYGVDIDTLAATLRRDGLIVDEVGKSFGVLKINNRQGDDLDISVPRKDSLTGAGHRDFDVVMEQDMSIEDASSRRDYTVNSLMYDDKLHVVIDPNNGLEDLKNKQLKHISSAFDEDLLRPLRGFQFAGRFGMTMHPETAQFCQTLAERAKTIPDERIATEWEKFYLKATEPSRSLRVLREMGWNGHAPGLTTVNVDGTDLGKKIDSAHHAAKKDTLNNEQRVALMSAVLTDTMDSDTARKFTKTTIIGHKLQRAAYELSTTKIDPEVSNYDLRRQSVAFSKGGTNIRDWVRKEEILGRGAAAKKVLAKAEKLNVADEGERPLLLGRHILDLTDKKPGRWMSELLTEAEEKQFQGELNSLDEAIAWAKTKV